MGKTWNIEEFKKVARKAAAEGCVLLKNDDSALPLGKGTKVALFGRNQMNYYKSGTGSGGMVNVDYVVGIYEALENSEDLQVNKAVREAYEQFVEENPFDRGMGWAAEPWFQKEMPLSDELVKKASEESDAAIFVIGRTAGEDQDNKDEQGSFLLTDEEKNALSKVCSVFKRTIVLLNVGNIIDMKWVKEINPSAVLYVWQGGQEGGNAVLDVITGAVNPSGKLSDTIASNISDYSSTENFGSEKKNFQVEDIYIGYRYFETFDKEAVLYPFGYGLSYTTFSTETTSFAYDEKNGVSVEVKVTNTGKTAGKEVVQVYAKAPQGALGKPERVLCGFKKTKLLEAGESQLLSFNIPKYSFASYDDGGVTGNKAAYVCEEGEYTFFAGSDVRSAEKAGSFTLENTEIIEQCEEAYAPVQGFDRLIPGDQEGKLVKVYEEVPTRTLDPNEKRLKNLPKTVE